MSTTMLKGLGLYCQWLCCDTRQSIHLRDGTYRTLASLNPYKHLKHILHICLVHFKRHIHDLQSQILKEVRMAMLSLASSEVHMDLDGAFATIRKGGKKAAGNIDELFYYCTVC